MEGVEYLNIHVGERLNTFGAIISLITLFIVIIGFVALMILLSDDNSSIISILLLLLGIVGIILIIWFDNSSICNDNYNIYKVKPIEDKYYIDADRFVIEEKDGNIIKVVDKVK